MIISQVIKNNEIEKMSKKTPLTLDNYRKYLFIGDKNSINMHAS